MKILITGGTGLVGSSLSKFKKDDCIFMSSKDCDLTNYEATYSFFKKHKPDIVIHLAAYVGGLYKNMNYKVEMYEKNILINFNVINICHKLGVKKVIGCLSTCIFPDKTAYPINESNLHNGPPHDSNYAYAYAKRMLEIQCRTYKEQYGDNFVCIIPTNLYGENDNYSLENGHVIPSLIHKCFLAKKQNKKFIVRGTGKPLRQFLYSTDIAKLIYWIVENYNDKEPIILSVGKEDEVSIEYISRLIAREFKYESELEFDTTYSDGQYKKTADNSKLLKLYGDFKFTPIEDGIKNSVNWFIQNYNACRK